MTNLPDDHIDPYESRLTRRVGAFADQAVRPIDASAIAAAAHAGARRQTLAGRLFGSTGSMGRIGIVLAGALIVTASIGVYVGGASPRPTQTPTPAGTGLIVVTPDCEANNLSAEIFAWEGAAGHRIATIRLLGIDAGCKVPNVLRPALMDSGGHALIVGKSPRSETWYSFHAGDRVETMVDMSNYCGAAPTGGLFLRLYLSDTVSVEARPAASIVGSIDPPPCNGPNAPATIEIQPLNRNSR